MSVQSEIDRIITAVGNAYSKVSEKGGTVPASQTVANLATAIDSIPSGGGSPSLQSKSVAYTSNGTATITPDEGYDGLSSVDVTVNVASGGGTNVITLEYTPVDKNLTISHDVLVGAGIDTEDKFFKIIGISIFPKNGDVDWFYVSYGGTLDKTLSMQNLIHCYTVGSAGLVLRFINLPTYGIPYSISLSTSDNYTADAVNKTLIVTLLLSE